MCISSTWKNHHLKSKRGPQLTQTSKLPLCHWSRLGIDVSIFDCVWFAAKPSLSSLPHIRHVSDSWLATTHKLTTKRWPKRCAITTINNLRETMESLAKAFPTSAAKKKNDKANPGSSPPNPPARPAPYHPTNMDSPTKHKPPTNRHSNTQLT